MNLLPIAVLYLVSKLRSGNGAAQPSWPEPKHPPPKRARHAAPAKHARPALAHPPQPDTNEAVHEPHPAQQHQAANTAPTGQAKPRKRKRKGVKFTDLSFAHMADADPSQHPTDVPHVQPAPAASNVETHQASDVVYSVARIQAVLRGLGWTGDNATKASHPAMSPDLTDGDYGPVTAGNWVRSARKRQLDPTIERIDGQHVHVNPDTFAALMKVARGLGANVSGERRPMYIP